MSNLREWPDEGQWWFGVTMFGRATFLAILIALSVSQILGVGCANRKSKMENTIGRAEALIDQRLYSEAIGYLTTVLQDNSGNLRLEALLANAYMGRAGFEFLPLVEKVMSKQDAGSLGLYQEPICSLAPVMDFSKLSFKCFAYRFMKHLPEADHPDLLQAQRIYRTYFKDPGSASVQVNFTAGLLEFAMFATRVRTLLKLEVVHQTNVGLNYDPYQFPFEVTLHHGKQGLEELNWSLARFRHSYQSLEKLIRSLNGQRIFTVGNRTLKFESSLQLSHLLRFFGLVVKDKAQALDQEMSEQGSAELEEMSPAIQKFLCATDPLCVMSQAKGDSTEPKYRTKNTLASHFFGDFLLLLADASESDVKITLFELAWRDPPPIVEQFFTSAQRAWDTESGNPIRNYLNETRAEWLELKKLHENWNEWLQQEMTWETQMSLMDRLSTRAKTEPTLLTESLFSRRESLLEEIKLAPYGQPSELKTWIIARESFLLQEGQELLDEADSEPESTPLLPSKITRMAELMVATQAWTDRNFYPVSEWADLQPRQSRQAKDKKKDGSKEQVKTRK